MNLLQKDLADGKRLWKEGKVHTLLFSEGTYQVEVDSLWPFLQLDDSGAILDAFCTCSAAEKKGSCVHLAAAYAKILGETGEPLHVRFRESLWNQIGFISMERHGDDPICLKETKEGFEAQTVTGKRLLLLRPTKAKTRKELEKLIFERPLETEETSLKFSKLSPEELALWKQGRPSEQLRYELSFWSDLAKWLMGFEEYKLLFEPLDALEPPHLLKVIFPGLEIEFYIATVLWPRLLEPLSKMKTSLPIQTYGHRQIREIRYDAKLKSFHIDFAEEKASRKAAAPPKEAEGTVIDDWIYFPHSGFFPKSVDPLLEESEIPPARVGQFLQKHTKLLQKFLKNEKIHLGAVPARYHLFFDDASNLHLSSYVFQEGDLHQEEASCFGAWVFLPRQGFFLLEHMLFSGKEKVIPKQQVSDFVGRHLVWLQAYDGFQTHVSTVESRLGYRFENDELVFFTRLEFSEETEEIIDFGQWIYVRGKGFYARSERTGAHLKAGLRISIGSIPSFIDKHRDELESIPHFFSHNCPLIKTGLNISLSEEGEIHVVPEYFFQTGQIPSKVQFFGNYTYVEGQGFFAIPSDLRLPENYGKEKMIEKRVEPYFVGYELDLLYPHLLTIDPRLKKPEKLILRLKHLKREEKARMGGWTCTLSYESEIGEVSVQEIWQALQNGQTYIFSPAGLIFLRTGRFEWLKRRVKRLWIKKGEMMRLSTLEFLQLMAFEELHEPVGKGIKEERTRSLFRDFLNFKTPTPIDLTGLKSELRPYQQTGVHWLWFLYSYGLSGLLCDEMGLGKTHQAMALIAGVKNAKSSAKILVVCPTSVIYHWEKLLENFLPNVSYFIFYGPDRRIETFSEGNFDLILTSYGTLRSEVKVLSKMSFDLAVYDETQVAKNEKSQVHGALRKMQAEMRLGLSGTPIENRLLELKSLFDLVIPGYFPSLSIFRDLFINPIEKHGDPQKKALLARLIHPFIMRRKKSEVLTELPEKMEEIAYCDLSEQQLQLYRSFVQAHQAELVKQLANEGAPFPLAHIFSLLTKLKRVCDHPSLILGDINNYKAHQSGKWDLFVELLSEVRDSGQKLVVFSQYLDMLDIIELHLKEEKIGFAEIRGSTLDRKEQVERFQTDPNCIVFVGSLQAAGVGIDLTAASVVIHYDRWWNPAKENQATDRVHRIGQKRGVQVFKLLAKKSIEEHIHLLIERKLSLAHGIIGFDSQDALKGLDRAELLSLMRQLAGD